MIFLAFSLLLTHFSLEENTWSVIPGIPEKLGLDRALLHSRFLGCASFLSMAAVVTRSPGRMMWSEVLGGPESANFTFCLAQTGQMYDNF